MPTDPDRRRGQSSREEDGYGGRFDEDAFDYPTTPPATEPWSAAETPPRVEPDESVPRSGESGGSGEPSGRKRAALRHGPLLPYRPVLAVAAALVALGGFGFALSAVSSTVTSDPRPAGTAKVPAPKPPSTDPLPPTASPPPNTGVTVAPTPTSTVPDDRHDDEHRARDDRARDDGKGADDH
ncbi:hypothetical protein ACIRVK_15685 [Streptomyces sp. NPDC101152]|uniref:hypothetical protein n=1 Tax=Streptomyces sp. NPDC101152 TaxID=3366116 RepID=UPI0037FD1B31